MSLQTLPNEIFADVLANIPTKDLLPLTCINHRFYRVISRLLHRRLLQVASLPDNDMILECYHPSAKLSTPTLACQYLHTKARGGDVDEVSPNVGGLRRLFSSFRPVVSEENRRTRRRRGPNSSTSAAAADEADDLTATEDIHLDDDQLFSQLCTSTSIVKSGPRPGLYLRHVNISDGVIRVWREWLAEMVADGGQARKRTGDDDSRFLWVGPKRTVGVRFRVSPGASERMPLISGPDDTPAIMYKLQFEELIVQTSQVLLAVEESETQDISHSGKAIVIASM